MTAAPVSTKALTLWWLISHLTNIAFPSDALATYLDWFSRRLSQFVDYFGGAGGVTDGETPPCRRFPDCWCFLGFHSTGIRFDNVQIYHTCSIGLIFFTETSCSLWLLQLFHCLLLKVWTGSGGYIMVFCACCIDTNGCLNNVGHVR